MRLIVAVFAALVIVLTGIFVATKLFEPAPAAERLAGVTVAVTRFTVDELDRGKHRLTLDIEVGSPLDSDVCMGFALDEPFANRRLETISGACVQPRAISRQAVRLTFDGLTDTDVAFQSHSLVWGVAGGRCGPIFEAVGVCVVDAVDTVDFELPRDPSLPTFGPIGTITTIFSFSPP